MANSYINFNKYYQAPQQYSHSREIWGDIAKGIGAIGGALIKKQVDLRRGLEGDQERAMSIMEDITDQRLLAGSQAYASKMREQISNKIKDSGWIITPKEKSDIQNEIKNLETILSNNNLIGQSLKEANKTMKTKDGMANYELDTDGWGDYLASLSTGDINEIKASATQLTQGNDTGIPFLNLKPKDPTKLTTDFLMGNFDKYAQDIVNRTKQKYGTGTIDFKEKTKVLSEDYKNQMPALLYNELINDKQSANILKSVRQSMTPEQRLNAEMKYSNDNYPELAYYANDMVDYGLLDDRIVAEEKYINKVDRELGSDDIIKLEEGSWKFGTTPVSFSRDVTYYQDGKEEKGSVSNVKINEIVANDVIPGTDKKGAYAIAQETISEIDPEYKRVAEKQGREGWGSLTVDEKEVFKGGAKKVSTKRNLYIPLSEIQDEKKIKDLNLENYEQYLNSELEDTRPKDWVQTRYKASGKKMPPKIIKAYNIATENPDDPDTEKLINYLLEEGYIQKQ